MDHYFVTAFNRCRKSSRAGLVVSVLALPPDRARGVIDSARRKQMALMA
jgi:hypothetical protein